MPEDKANPHEFEKLAYIKLVADVNESRGVTTAEDYDGLAATTQCRIWEQMKDDLISCEAYRDGIRRRVAKYPALCRYCEPENAYLEVFPEAVRIAIGKAICLRDAAELRTDKDWVAAFLFYGKRAFYSFLWVVATGKVKPPERDKTEATADHIPKPDGPANPRVQSLTDQQATDDDTMGEELFSEGKEPSPTAKAENECILNQMDRLDAKERTVLQLRFMERKSRKDVTELIGLSEHRVMRLELSGLRKLRQAAGCD